MQLLSGNALKLIAAATMFLDHMAVMLFPGNELLRALGRLAMPIYAFMISEGCKYTRNKANYFCMVLSLALVCQTVYFLFSGDTYFSILFTFSLAIVTVYALQRYQNHPCAENGILFSLVVAGIYQLNRFVTIDYGFWGCMLPAFPAMLHGTAYDRQEYKTAMLALGLVLLASSMGENQIYSLGALPLLLLYSGKRGKWKMKYFFYIFYPAHMALLEGIVMLRRYL